MIESPNMDPGEPANVTYDDPNLLSLQGVGDVAYYFDLWDMQLQVITIVTSVTP